MGALWKFVLLDWFAFSLVYRLLQCSSSTSSSGSSHTLNRCQLMNAELVNMRT